MTWNELIAILATYAGVERCVLYVIEPWYIEAHVDPDKIDAVRRVAYEYVPITFRLDVKPIGPAHRFTTGFHWRDLARWSHRPG